MEQETAFTTRERQKVKTSGHSQYLYTLAVTDIKNEQSEEKKNHKLVWNKTYKANNAPHTIKNEIMHTSRQL